MPSPAQGNPLLAPVPCQSFADHVRLPDGTQRVILTVLHAAGMASVFLDPTALDDLIAVLTEARGQMSGLILPRPVPPGLGPPNGQGGR